MRRWLIGGCLALVAVGLPLGWCIWAFGPSPAFEGKCRCLVHTGMTLTEVESVLGPGKRREGPPNEQDGKGGSGPVIGGDEFFRWDGPNGEKFYVGLRDGRVCETWFWAPSL